MARKRKAPQSELQSELALDLEQFQSEQGLNGRTDGARERVKQALQQGELPEQVKPLVDFLSAPKQHPTYRFLLKRHEVEPNRPTFLIVGNIKLLALINGETADDELELYSLYVHDKESNAEWRDETFAGLEWRLDDLVGKDTASSLSYLEELANQREGGAFFVTSSLAIDLEAGGATSLTKATARGALGLWGEWDDIPHSEQLARIEQLKSWGLDTHRVTSGGDSIHWHIPFKSCIDWDIALPLLRKVTALLGTDTCCVSKARRMRLPGLTRKRQSGEKQEQKLLQLTEKLYGVEEVEAILEHQFQSRGWIYSEKRFALYNRARKRGSAGRALPSGWVTFEDAFKRPEREIHAFLPTSRERGLDSDALPLPPVWLREETPIGSQIRRLQSTLLTHLGLIGAYQLAVDHGTLKDKPTADGQAFDLELKSRGAAGDLQPHLAEGCSPWSEFNRSKTALVLFGETGRWFCRSTNDHGSLAEFLIHFCPGIDCPEDPSDREQRLLFLWMSELAGEDVEQAAQIVDDGEYGETMATLERLVNASLEATGNELKQQAINAQLRRLRVTPKEFLKLKLKQLSGELRQRRGEKQGESYEHPDNIDGPVIQDFLYRGLVGLVGGSFAGKTNLMTFLAGKVMTGSGLVISNRIHAVTAGNVLICTSDAGRKSFEDDLIRQGVDLNDPKIQARLRFLSDATYDDMPEIVQAMIEHKPELTIMDSLTSMKPSGISLNDDAISEPLYFLSRENGKTFPRHCMITAIHTTKREPRLFSGSSTIKAALDSLAIYYIPEEGKVVANPARVLSYLGADEAKCRHGNAERSWSFRYEDIRGTWTIDEINTFKKGGSLQRQLRALIELHPWVEWKRLSEVMEVIKPPRDMQTPSGRKAVQRHLQTLTDLVEVDRIRDPRTKQEVATYRVRTAEYQRLVTADRGSVACNVIGEKPVGKTLEGKQDRY